jgi:preprotein translocase subunit SecF
MIQLFKDTHYDFIGKRRWAYLLSAAFITAGLVSIGVKGGLRYGIDFSGGTLIQARFENAVPVSLIRNALDRIKGGESIIQEFGDPREFIFRLPLLDASAEEVTRRVQGALAAEPALGKAEVRRVEFVGPQVGRDLQLQALYAVLASAAGILIYIAIRFDFKGGVAAIVATFHDVLVTFSAMSLSDREISLPVLAAFLTIIGYSVNDTIVAFDRLRENRGKGIRKGISFAEQMNAAINQTLSRTVLTSLTTFLSSVLLFLFGGKVLEDFAFVLTVGVVTGTFSTIYVAGAILVDWNAWGEARTHRAKKAVAKA